MTPLLLTTRLRLRSPGIGDAPRMAEFLSNFAVSGNLARVPHPYSLDHAREWLGRWRADAKPGATNFVIELPGDGAIGHIGMQENDGRPSIGYWLGEPYWGRGFMTEAVEAVIAWYFATSNADLLFSGVFHFNMASLAIQQKLGFVETGRSEVYCLARDAEVEHIDTELSREAFDIHTARQAGNKKLA